MNWLLVINFNVNWFNELIVIITYYFNQLIIELLNSIAVCIVLALDRLFRYNSIKS